MESLKLRRVGGDVVITIPDDVLDQLGLEEGDSLTLGREAARIDLQPRFPDVESASRMLQKYDGVLGRLAG